MRRVEDRFGCWLSEDLGAASLGSHSTTFLLLGEDFVIVIGMKFTGRMERGHMVGSREHVSWGAMVVGPTCSLGNGYNFDSL